MTDEEIEKEMIAHPIKRKKRNRRSSKEYNTH